MPRDDADPDDDKSELVLLALVLLALALMTFRAAGSAVSPRPDAGQSSDVVPCRRCIVCAILAPTKPAHRVSGDESFVNKIG